MKKRDLFNLRDNFLEFENPQDLGNKLLDIFNDKCEFPLVYGYEAYKDSKDKFTEWNLDYLKPYSISDELSVRNFLGGLKELCELKSSFLEKFNGYLGFSGVDRKNIDYCQQKLFSAGFGEKENSYFLNVIFSLKYYSPRDKREFRYKAEIGSYTSEIGRIMNKYLIFRGHEK